MWHRLLMLSVDRFLLPSSSAFFYSLVCPLIWLSSLCHSVPRFISFSHSFQMTVFLLFLLSSLQSIVSLVPVSVPLPLFFSHLPLFLSKPDSAFLSQVSLSYFDFFSLQPVLFAPSRLFLFIYIEINCSKAVGLDWWMVQRPRVKGFGRLMDTPVSQQTT